MQKAAAVKYVHIYVTRLPASAYLQNFNVWQMTNFILFFPWCFFFYLTSQTINYIKPSGEFLLVSG